MRSTSSRFILKQMKSVKTLFVLTNDEKNLFSILLDSIHYHKKKTIARVAGGWVRDKLLGKFSDDIDIALDDQSGVEFANNVNNYLRMIGKDTRKIAVIQANPDQSKHLETANLRVLGFDIDCVNLRVETYASDSRIPDIQYGTAYDDAMRRDFTINALFYNLNNQEIEDFTTLGLQDMQNKIIRTPLPPILTFRDDPLRVLRAIRFASRFRFQLHDDIVTAARDKEIQAALCSKISRERILKECEGMISSASSRPILAFSLLHQLHVFDSVFTIPSMQQQQNNNNTTHGGNTLASAPLSATGKILKGNVANTVMMRQTSMKDDLEDKYKYLSRFSSSSSVSSSSSSSLQVDTASDNVTPATISTTSMVEDHQLPLSKNISLEAIRWCNVLLALQEEQEQHDLVMMPCTADSDNIDAATDGADSDKADMVVDTNNGNSSDNGSSGDVVVMLPGCHSNRNTSSTSIGADNLIDSSSSNSRPAISFSEYVARRNQHNNNNKPDITTTTPHHHPYFTVNESSIFSQRGDATYNRALFWAASVIGYRHFIIGPQSSQSLSPSSPSASLVNNNSNKKASTRPNASVKTVYMPTAILTEGLKMDGDTIKQVCCLHEASAALRDILNSLSSSTTTSVSLEISSVNNSSTDNIDLLHMIQRVYILHNNSNNINASSTNTNNTTNNNNYLESSEFLSHHPAIVKLRFQAGLVLKEMMVNPSYGMGTPVIAVAQANNNNTNAHNTATAASTVCEATRLWKCALLLACAEDIAKMTLESASSSSSSLLLQQQTVGTDSNTTITSSSSNSIVDSTTDNTYTYVLDTKSITLNSDIIKIIDRYALFQKTIEWIGLDKIWFQKPLMDGKIISDSVGVPKGPFLGKIMNEQVVWQLLHPQGELKDCVVYLKDYLSQHQLEMMQQQQFNQTSSDKKNAKKMAKK